MKKLIFLFALLLTTCFNSFGQATLGEAKKLGLVSYLTYVKSAAEFQMLTLVTSPQYKIQTDKAKAFNSRYNILKINVDRLINQLSADLYQRNGLRVYKALNNHQKTDKALAEKYKAYADILKLIDADIESFLIQSYSSKNGASLADITAVAELGINTVTSARDFREKKVQSITGLIKELRLVKISELTKPAEKEKE